MLLYLLLSNLLGKIRASFHRGTGLEPRAPYLFLFYISVYYHSKQSKLTYVSFAKCKILKFNVILLYTFTTYYITVCNVVNKRNIQSGTKLRFHSKRGRVRF